MCSLAGESGKVVIPFSKFYVPVDKNVSSKIGNRALEPQVELVEFDPEMSVAGESVCVIFKAEAVI
ncbi:hypothetical protein TcasGA2_TC005507 [Tribolium castaneum]|uniref:Uncharacterized protein n=1 Tax=Tribolium castaneum TaxID=7070 RepID=D6WXU6_TRICA|nr:hypothetical protein TcasGA2_TC005507 [Tribolium castaneum]